MMADLRRVVLFGKSGSGKSSVANTILGNPLFQVNHGSDSKSKFSEAKTRMVHGQNLTVIDTPGLFNTDRTKDEVQSEIYSCLTQCAPGPHAFLFVLLVEKFTEQEQAIVDHIKQVFGEDVFRYTTVVFTHGDQLQEGTVIMDFVNQSNGLKELIQKCGGRCHVIDNKYWKNSQDPYRNNSFQVGEIINSIQITIRNNNGEFFSNDELKCVEKCITAEQNRIHNSQGLSQEESRELAKQIVLQKYIRRLKLKRYTKYVLIGLSVAILLQIGYSSFKGGRATSNPTPGVEEPPPSVIEAVQDTVAPIKTFFDYVIETIGAIFGRANSKQVTLPNRTHGEF